jgi:hypothetical protein
VVTGPEAAVAKEAVLSSVVSAAVDSFGPAIPSIFINARPGSASASVPTEAFAPWPFARGTPARVSDAETL